MMNVASYIHSFKSIINTSKTDFSYIDIANKTFQDSHMMHQDITSELHFLICDFYIIYPERIFDVVDIVNNWNFIVAEKHVVNAILCVSDEVFHFIAEVLKKIVVVLENDKKKIQNMKFRLSSLHNTFLQLQSNLDEITSKLKSHYQYKIEVEKEEILGEEKKQCLFYHLLFFQNFSMFVKMYVKKDSIFHEILQIKVGSCNHIDALSRELSSISYYLNSIFDYSSLEIINYILYSCLKRLYKYFSILYSIRYDSHNTMLDWLEKLLFDNQFCDMHTMVYIYNCFLKD